jgi:hypothetical protein
MSPTKKIKKLTPDQEAELPIFRDQWFQFGTLCEPADQDKSKSTIDKMYNHIGKSGKRYIFCDSPMTSALAMVVFNSGALSSLGSSLRSSLGSSLRSSLGSSLGSSLESSLESSLWSSLRSSLGSSLESSLWSSLGSSLRSSLGSSLGSSLRSSLWSSLGSRFLGQQDAYWIAFYKFCEKIGVQYEASASEHLNWWSDIAKSCMWWWPFENYCIVSNRPLVIRMDERRVLHSFDKPAIEFRDGWKIYAIHNALIPEKYIETSADEIDPSEVLKEGNSTVRMAVIQKLGFLRFKNKLPHTTISKANSVDLLEFDLNGRKVRGLHVRWKDKFDKALETIIPVPRTKEQFSTTGEIPENPDDAEQVRRWTLFSGKEDRFLAET